MAGRPRLPTELKKLQGTINTTREKQNPGVDVQLANTSVIMEPGAHISVPKSLTNKVVRKFWKDEISNLQTMRVLSKVDLQQLETLCITLQKLREVQEEFVNISPLEEGFDDVEKRFERLSNKFDQLANKFYISPQARTQLKLNDLTLVKTAQEIQKNQSAISSLLENRQ